MHLKGAADNMLEYLLSKPDYHRLPSTRPIIAHMHTRTRARRSFTHRSRGWTRKSAFGGRPNHRV